MPSIKSWFTILESDEYLCMPWKNGLGETLEIHKHEDDQGLRYRISQAAVTDDGRFSDFSGLQRTLLLLRGQGMTLTLQGGSSVTQHELIQPLDQASFDGGTLTDARLHGGPIDDLNIMVRANDTLANVVSMTAPEACPILSEAALLCGFYALEAATFAVTGDMTPSFVRVPEGGFIQFHVASPIQLNSGRGAFIVIKTKA